MYLHNLLILQYLNFLLFGFDNSPDFNPCSGQTSLFCGLFKNMVHNYGAVVNIKIQNVEAPQAVRQKYHVKHNPYNPKNTIHNECIF